jgi:zinc and cadmium transporter
MHPESTRIVLAASLGVIAAGGNLLGGYFVVRREWPRHFLRYFLALGAGYMLGVSLLEIIPESIRLTGSGALLYVLLGYFLVQLFEHTLAPHFHFGEETHAEVMRQAHAGTTALIGLMIHTFFDGVAIAAGFLVSNWLGTAIFIAIFLHKLPEGFTVASLMLASGRTRRVALWASVLLGAATLAGVLVTGALRASVSYALPLSGGVTLYVAASDLMPEVNREPNWRSAALVFVGVAILFILQRLFNG